MKTLTQINHTSQKNFLTWDFCFSKNPKSIVIIDPTIPDSQHIVQGIKPGTANYILESQPNAIEQITTILAQHTGIESLHIISHGSPGNLYLGTTELNSSNIENYSQQLRQWRNAFTPHASIILYGCNVAAGDSGSQFLTQLYQLTGANIAANPNPTGNAEKGGTWSLTYQYPGDSPLPDSALPFSPQALATYSGLLGVKLVKDINPENRSSPTDLTNVNGTLYFRANDGTHGGELWKSDGTAAGTVLVKDINPGANDSLPIDLTNVNGTLYFKATYFQLTDPINDFELWKSDGTAAGTVLLKDINRAIPSNPINLTNVNGTLYFTDSDPNNSS